MTDGKSVQKGPSAWVWERQQARTRTRMPLEPFEVTRAKVASMTVQSSYEGPDSGLDKHMEPLADVDLSEITVAGVAERQIADIAKHTIEPDIFEPEHAQLAEGVQFAKLYGELRRVREELAAERAHVREIAEDWHADLAELNATKKQRDRFRDSLKDLGDKLRRSQADSKAAWQGDEGKVLDMLAERLRLGERSYGALDVNDNRDMVREATEEALDLAVYLATQLIRIRESGYHDDGDYYHMRHQMENCCHKCNMVLEDMDRESGE